MLIGVYILTYLFFGILAQKCIYTKKAQTRPYSPTGLRQPLINYGEVYAWWRSFNVD